mmetsp:Transcript_48076/g.97876  ORF Transcript_48076/g.97876 Transcript_48076/m.97876 type:complete len:208 (-) Transcript_48076:984-1607(-)
MPTSAGIIASPVSKSIPHAMPLASCSSCTLINVSLTSRPEFSARVLGMTRSASANARTPSLALPFTVRMNFMRSAWHAISKAPAPGTTASSSIALRTARRPSRTASLSWAMVCGLGPFTRMVHENGLRTSSTNVYLLSPSTCSYTLPAKPSTSGLSSSQLLTARPPHASVNRSMLRRFARRMPMMPSLASMSSDSGSMPFWLMTTNV